MYNLMLCDKCEGHTFVITGAVWTQNKVSTKMTKQLYVLCQGCGAGQNIDVFWHDLEAEARDTLQAPGYKETATG